MHDAGSAERKKCSGGPARQRALSPAGEEGGQLPPRCLATPVSRFNRGIGLEEPRIAAIPEGGRPTWMARSSVS